MSVYPPARLRGQIDAYRDSLAKRDALWTRDPGTAPGDDALVEAILRFAEAREELQDSAVYALPALLDELETARALLSEVRDHGLASFDPAQKRLDLTRRVVAFLES